MSRRDILDAATTGSVTGSPSFSLANRAERALFAIVWFLACRWTPPPMHAWRRFVLRLFGAKMGVGTRIYASAKVWLPSNLEMEEFALIGPKVNVYCQGRIRLRRYAIVSQYAHLVTGSHEVDDPDFQLFVAPIEIGENAWVAANSFVGPGVTVGAGAVLGACGVAFKDLAPWTINVGNPARLTSYREEFFR